LSEYGGLAIQANGVLSQINATSVKRLASISGIQDAVAVSPSRIAIGKVRGGGLPSPLLYYSIPTGELSPSFLEAIAVIRLRLSPSGRLYAVCIEESEGKIVTSIREIRDDPSGGSIIASAPGEHFGTQLAFDSAGNVFFSFGDDRSIMRMKVGGETVGIGLGDYPEKVAVGGVTVFVLHADGSFSAIDMATDNRSRFAIDAKGGLLTLE